MGTAKSSTDARLSVAFLRGMNLGGRRITNPDLCAALARQGFEQPTAFLASGNVVFRARGPAATLEARVEQALAKELGYPVPTFIRTAEEVRAIADARVFATRDAKGRSGKPQVMFLRTAPARAAKGRIASLSTDDDWLELHGRELHWWPAGGLAESSLDLKPVEAALGQATVRTMNTVKRLAAKYLSGT